MSKYSRAEAATRVAVQRSRFQETHIWPVELILPQRAGFIVWGCGDGERDRAILTRDDHVAMVTNLDDLNVLRDLASGQFAAGAAAFFAAVRSVSDPELDEVLQLDFLAVLSIMESGRIPRSAFGHVLNCINMAYDITHSLADAREAVELVSAAGPLGLLADETLLTYDGRHYACSETEARSFREIASFLSGRCRVLPTRDTSARSTC